MLTTSTKGEIAIPREGPGGKWVGRALLYWFRRGEVAEWSIAAVSKTVEPLRVPGVRISPSPPVLFSRRGAGFCRQRLSLFFTLRLTPGLGVKLFVFVGAIQANR